MSSRRFLDSGSDSDSHSNSDSENSSADRSREEDDSERAIKWLQRFVLSELGLKKDKWKKMMLISECRYAIHNFVEEPSLRWILFHVNGPELLAGVKYPAQLSKKALYLIKEQGCPEVLSPETMDEFIKSGDLHQDPLEQLSLVVNEVYTPLLKNRRNHSGWPDVVEEDVLRHFHKLAGSVYVIEGQTNGKTLLPLPPEADGTDTATHDKSLVHQIESAVIEWTHQVRAVVKSSNDETLKRAYANLQSALNTSSASLGLKGNIDLSIGPNGELRLDGGEPDPSSLASAVEGLISMPGMDDGTNPGSSSSGPSSSSTSSSSSPSANGSNGSAPASRGVGDEDEDETSPTSYVAFPGPASELDFWEAKAANLQCIHDQLYDEKMRKIGRVLDISRSSYYPAFQAIYAEVDTALTEAYDIHKCISPLRTYVDSLANLSAYVDIATVFKPFIHVLALVWSSSEYYTVPHLIVLIQELCNDVIAHTREYIDAERLFSIETPDAVESLHVALEVLAQFKSTFTTYKAQINAEHPERAWRFEDGTVFKRLDQFRARLEDLLDLMQTILEFNKLEKVEVGGSKGEVLTATVVEIFKEFEESVDVFAGIEYDVLDVYDIRYAGAAAAFRVKIEDLERRISTVISEGFDDAVTVSASFKLLDSFHGMLHRDAIRSDFDSKYVQLVEMYSVDLDQVHGIFVRERDAPPVHTNLPPVAGAVFWARNLRQRISEPHSKLLSLDTDVLELPQGLDVLAKYETLLNELSQYEAEKHVLWVASVDLKASEKLNNALLARDENTKKLEVNFAPALVTLLREVKYLEYLGLDIPPAGSELYAESEMFRAHIAGLNIIVDTYNKIISTLLPVEVPLVEDKLNQIDRELEQGIHHLNWRSTSIGEFIGSVSDLVSDVDSILTTLKNNVDELEYIMLHWSNRPLISRRDTRKGLDMGDCREKIMARSLEIELQGGKIHSLIRESRASVGLESDAAPWVDYVAYVNGIVKRGFHETVRVSLQFLVDNMSDEYLRRNELPPLFEARLELREPEVVYSPPLLASSEADLKQIFVELMAAFTKIGKLVKRIDAKGSSGKKENYFRFLNEDPTLRQLRNEIIDNINVTIQDCLHFKNEFMAYSDLWIHDRNDYMESFLLYGKELELGEDELLEHADVEESAPTLEDFAHQIDQQSKYLESVMDIQDSAIFHWLKINIKPFKSSLANVIRKWRLMFTQHLYNDVVGSLDSLSSFIDTTRTGLSKDVKEGDYAALVETMGVLRDVRSRIDATDSMFKPLHDKITMLKEYNIDMPGTVIDQLNDLPQEWTNLKRSMYGVRDKLTPLQQIEVEKIKKRRDAFMREVATFRVSFERSSPTSWDMDQLEAYAIVDGVFAKLAALEASAIDLADQEELFELTVTTYKELPTTRKELLDLKALWDMISLVRYQFEEWRSTLWTDIDTDQMDADCKGFLKMIRSLPRETKRWDARAGLDVYLKNLLKSLRSISDLRSPALRQRHWDALMRETGVAIDVSGNVYLKDLLALELHKYEEVVSNIVDSAVKELRMESALAEISEIWRTMEFSYESHSDGTPLLKPDDDLIETLEENMVKLQNMLSSKSVSYFLDKIERWQSKLSNVDTVLHLWLEVQRTWLHMESIFIGSEDIREQLPEDSKRFDRIDGEWKRLMEVAAETSNVIDVTSTPGRAEKLTSLEAALEKCAKALEQYLETKRLAFPRFYFISTNDLLDILSKGADPKAIMIHIPKLFDNIKYLDFADDGVTAIRMHSAEGESVDLTVPCECTGQVEVWLNRLIDSMRESLRALLAEAYVSYEEKPRVEWLLEYAAQIALAGSQIWYAQEVDQAFERLVDGYESALKDYLKKVLAQLTTLIQMLQGNMAKLDRKKIMTICTYDTHSRDVLRALIADKKVENRMAFGWQSQLRLRWDEDRNDCFISICDAEFQYQYEYLGNQTRLVITPLTDRCYITLTQALRLVMGGSPAGPAGTGKTETTKDLGRVLGIRVLVQNCSPQQTYLDLANIFKGLAQSGMWGCFDEFNRISIEVLSVVSTQVKSILDAIRARKSRFDFMGQEIALNRNVGMFITMNPGYAGRTELPDNLKSLFRPVSMVVPDLDRICEIMLIAEGFEEAQDLALKFTTLYALASELLSKQDHYDWGLRAIKSVLVVAGPLKRAEPHLSEESILMRALRDFNLPKIVAEDVSVFMNLINDLFPEIALDRKVDAQFEAAIEEVLVEAGLQPEPVFILKVVQLAEILDVRHSVFIIGPSGSGKSEVWKTLAATWTKMGSKTLVRDISPKTVSTNELYGFSNPVTKEYTDGLFSKIMRDLKDMPDTDPKWIVLDGDIDTLWIESLNTVMDDNKVLTLPSNERIDLLGHMRLLFEIGGLKHASPATVSRAGILFLNESDLGWGPYHLSWINSRSNVGETSNLTVLFDKYVANILEFINKNLEPIIPVSNFAMVQALCNLLDGLLTPANVPPGSDKELYEYYFCFACVWAFGGAFVNEGSVTKHKAEFSSFLKSETRAVKFPSSGTVYDYYVDSTGKWAPWSDLVPSYEHDMDGIVSRTFVPTAETERIRYFTETLIRVGTPVMLVGGAGCGKTMLIKNILAGLDDNEYMSLNINLNYYTSSKMLQSIMDAPLERKMRRDYGPPGMKKLIYFVDDLNMPMLDTYDTQRPLTLLRQYLDYGHWYDRAKWELRNILRCQFVAAMSPSTGTFTVDPRLQRHFTTIAVEFPNKDSLVHVYTSILNGHLAEFRGGVAKMGPTLVEGLYQLHTLVSNTFLPTAIKFHYQFNLRDIASVVQGLLESQRGVIKEPLEMVRLLVHECRRNYADVLTSQEEIGRFETFLADMVRKNFTAEYKLREEDVMVEPLLFSHFALGVGDGTYARVSDYNSLHGILMEALEQYNELNAEMDLVLFQDAMEHVCRISRIIMSGEGNALLVGVGGSGKQSLSRLAASINAFEVFQIQVKSNYGVPELKADLIALFAKAGGRGDDVVFLLTDTQIVNEEFLIYVNDLLSSGDIPDLYTVEDKDSIISSIRTEVKQAGIMDTRDNCWAYFIGKVQRHLHVILCFSPVGDAFRERYRRFPALVNNCSIDWFHAWPHEALVSVADYFLSDTDLATPEVKKAVVAFMAECHASVEVASVKFREVYRRYNYTTPKSFLELITLYKAKLASRRDEIVQERERLTSGLDRLESAADQVAQLHERLAEEKIELEARTKVTQELVAQLAADTEKVDAEREAAEEEERKTDLVAQEVAKRQAVCDEDLKKAEPALIRAMEALNTFDRDDIVFVRSLPAPPKAVVKVLASVMVLQSPAGRLKRDVSWAAAKKTMKDVNRFMESLREFKKDEIPPENIRELERKYLNDPEFNRDSMMSKSRAAAGLCEFVINIVEYHRIYLVVQPKRDALAEATQQLEVAQAKLDSVQKRVGALKRNLEELTTRFEQANAEKMEMEAQAEQTAMTIQLADRLVAGLAGEKVRWGSEVEGLRVAEDTLVGDVLAAAAFISYIGPFNRPLREELVKVQWLPWLIEHGVPLSENYDPLDVLTSDAQIAAWNNEGLPTDRISLENAAIAANCERWPLIVDPQNQAISWLKARAGFEDMLLLNATKEGYLPHVIDALQGGGAVLLDDVREEIDPMLGPILGRNVFRRAGEEVIVVGGEERTFSRNFKLFMVTKMGNPHFRPEIQAQTTLINFTVTEDGLEDQLLATVVKHERPDLEAERSELIRQQNEFEIRLKELESSLLEKLQEAEGDFLSDTALVENLETTKALADDITTKKAQAVETREVLNGIRNEYRPVATRGSLLYFLLNDLANVDHMYQYSLDAFSLVFERGMAPEGADGGSGSGGAGSSRSSPGRRGRANSVSSSSSDDEEDVNLEELTEEEKRERERAALDRRVTELTDSITRQVFKYASRGLFERHKLIFASLLCFRILESLDEVDPAELEFLVRGGGGNDESSPLDWCSGASWGMIQALSKLPAFKRLADDIEGSSARWRKWTEEPYPEDVAMPQEWKSRDGIKKLCIIRCLRPDRLVAALTSFITKSPHLGEEYVDYTHAPLWKTFEETTPTTPLFFILSPGVDPLKDLEVLGRRRGYTLDNGKLVSVSLGQGQDVIALKALERAHAEGTWVLLSNIHLMVSWLPTLERKMEELRVTESHPDFRLFLSAEPSTQVGNQIPVAILQQCIKITSEPPRGIRASMLRAMDNFDQDALERSSKETEYHAIWFALCFYHALLLERTKYGAIGWNRTYPFNSGDLTVSVDVVVNYLEANTRVPWEDICYVTAQLFWGGHVSDDMDRRLCQTYIESLLRPELLNDEMELTDGFPVPPHGNFESYKQYVDEVMPAESPSVFGMPRNAETGYLTQQADTLFKTVLSLQPQIGGGAGSESKEERVLTVMTEILDSITPDTLFNMSELYLEAESKMEDPFVVVALQEADRMNILVAEILRSLTELDLGLRGELMMSDAMETLLMELFTNKIPSRWAASAPKSQKTLSTWFGWLKKAIRQLQRWLQAFKLPVVLNLSLLFNPQSFLTAVMQATARRQGLPLDSMRLVTDVTKRKPSEISTSRLEGAYITGVHMEGAQWDSASSQIVEAGTELFCEMPVIYCRAVESSRFSTQGLYEAPLYRTRKRGGEEGGYIWPFYLRSGKAGGEKWVMAGCALLLQTD